MQKRKVVYDELEEVRQKLTERFVAAFKSADRSTLPRWLRSVRFADDFEYRQGYTAVVETLGKPIPLRIVCSPHEMDLYNHDFPSNGQLIIALFDTYSDHRIVSKSMNFIEREYYK